MTSKPEMISGVFLGIIFIAITFSQEYSLSRLISFFHAKKDYRQVCHVVNKTEDCKLGMFQDASFAVDLQDSKSTSRRCLVCSVLKVQSQGKAAVMARGVFFYMQRKSTAKQEIEGGWKERKTLHCHGAEREEVGLCISAHSFPKCSVRCTLQCKDPRDPISDSVILQPLNVRSKFGIEKVHH